jgi:aminoglycoside phosphotransferase
MSDEGPQEVPLHGGWVTEGVVRIGDTVRRPPSANSEFVAELLLYLEHAGFDGAPRFLGYDEQDRAILTFIDGEAPSDCRSIVWTDEQIAASMKLLRGLHDQTAGSEIVGTAEVVCHHDYGPWNLVWRDDLPVAIIDFDNAAPGRRLDDLAYAAWKHLNLGSIDLPLAVQRRRLGVLARGYGVQPDTGLLAAIRAAQMRMRRLIEAAPAGEKREDALAKITGEQNWLSSNGSGLAS